MHNDNQQHKPSFIPQIGIPEKEKFNERTTSRAIYHKATSPGFFGIIVLCFFMPFINIKCGGRVVEKYSGIDIIQGNQKPINKNEAEMAVGVRQSAYHQFEIAKENFKWKQNLKENYEEYIDDAPVIEDDFSAQDDFGKMPRNLNEASSNPKVLRLLVFFSFLVAIGGLLITLWQKRIAVILQIILGFIGFLTMFMVQFYVKVTLPNVAKKGAFFQNEYTQPIITTEFALAYWMVLFLFLGVAIIGILKLRWQKKWDILQKN